MPFMKNTQATWILFSSLVLVCASARAPGQDGGGSPAKATPQSLRDRAMEEYSAKLVKLRKDLTDAIAKRIDAAKQAVKPATLAADKEKIKILESDFARCSDNPSALPAAGDRDLWKAARSYEMAAFDARSECRKQVLAIARGLAASSNKDAKEQGLAMIQELDAHCPYLAEPTMFVTAAETLLKDLRPIKDANNLEKAREKLERIVVEAKAYRLSAVDLRANIDEVLGDFKATRRFLTGDKVAKATVDGLSALIEGPKKQ